MRNKEFPEIRFSGFKKEWEHRKIGELADIVRGASPRPIQDPKWFDVNSEVGWLRIADVTEQSGRIYYLKQRISIAGQQKTRVLNTPHLLLSIAATVGKPVVNYVKTGVHDGFLIFQNPVVDCEFMFQWLEMFRPKWGKYGQPGSQVNLNSELVREQEIMVPNKDEQVKIGDFFKKLDDTINLHQQELNTLKQTKQGFLQKMFPKEGESVPEIRFPEFTGEWKNHTLGETVDSMAYGINASSKEYDGENKYIRITDIDDITHKFLKEKITSPNTDLSLAEEFLLNEGDILFARTGASVGKTYIYDSKDGKVYYAGFLIRARIKDEYVPEFIFQNTLTSRYLKFIKVASQRSGQPGINAQEYAGFSFMIPDKKEQQEISDFFKQLDEVIALHQQELDALKQTKKAFLQKMFV